MSHHKTACIAFFIRRKLFVINVDFFVSVMRFCKNCVAFHQLCQMNDTSKKCISCNVFDRFCDLYVFSIVIQRLHCEQMKLRKQMRDVRAIVIRENAKFVRLKQQLEHIENRKKKLISIE